MEEGDDLECASDGDLADEGRQDLFRNEIRSRSLGVDAGERLCPSH